MLLGKVTIRWGVAHGWLLWLTLGAAFVFYMTIRADATTSCECKLAARHLRAAQALEAKQLHREAREEYKNAINTKCCCRLEEAVAGFVRTTEQVKAQDVGGAKASLKLGQKMVRELKFAEGKTYIEKADMPETRVEVISALDELHAREGRLSTTLWLALRSAKGAIPGLIAVALLVLCGLIGRCIALMRRAAMVRPLQELGDGAVGRTFAEVLDRVAYEIVRPPRPGSIGPPMIMVDRSRELPDVSLRVGFFEVRNFLRALAGLVWPSMLVVEGTVMPGGAVRLVEVRLNRTQLIRPSVTLARWTFRVPTADDEARIAAMRASAYTVLFRVLVEE